MHITKSYGFFSLFLYPFLCVLSVCHGHVMIFGLILIQNLIFVWFFLLEFVCDFVVRPGPWPERAWHALAATTRAGMSKKFTFQRGGHGAPGNPQPPGRESSAQRLQTAWRAHACRWPLARVPQGSVRIAATLRALLLLFHLAHIVVASMHVTFIPSATPRL